MTQTATTSNGSKPPRQGSEGEAGEAVAEGMSVEITIGDPGVEVGAELSAGIVGVSIGAMFAGVAVGGTAAGRVTDPDGTTS